MVSCGGIEMLEARFKKEVEVDEKVLAIYKKEPVKGPQSRICLSLMYGNLVPFEHGPRGDLGKGGQMKKASLIFNTEEESFGMSSCTRSKPGLSDPHQHKKRLWPSLLGQSTN